MEEDIKEVLHRLNAHDKEIEELKKRLDTEDSYKPTGKGKKARHRLNAVVRNGVKSTIDPCKIKKNYGVTLNCELHSSLCTIQRTCGISINK